jgi:hypothetical protein
VYFKLIECRIQDLVDEVVVVVVAAEGDVRREVVAVPRVARILEELDQTFVNLLV